MYDEYDDIEPFEDDSSRRYDYDVDDALAALPIDLNNLVPPEVVIGLSDLSKGDLEKVRSAWAKLATDQRIAIMQRLAEASEVDYAVDYGQFARLGYDDSSETVRAAALQAGWTDDSIETMHKIIELARVDVSSNVRATAMIQLGRFILLGELEDLPYEDTLPAQEVVAESVQDIGEDVEVQRRALEALAHATRVDLPELILRFYEHENPKMRISAVNAMANSCDERWEEYIVEELQTSDDEMRYEAIRAAGSIQLASTVPYLQRLGKSDDELERMAVVWALGEIGGESAVEALGELFNWAESVDDDELAEAVLDAQMMAQIMGDMDLDFGLLGIEPDDLDDLAGLN